MSNISNFNLPPKQKPKIEKCTKNHFEKNFIIPHNGIGVKGESIYAKLEELEFREPQFVEETFDEDYEFIDSDLPPVNDNNLDPNKDTYQSFQEEEKTRRLSSIIKATDWKFFQDNLFLENNAGYMYRLNEIVDLTGKLLDADDGSQIIAKDAVHKNPQKVDICLVVDSSRSSLYYAYEMYRTLVNNSFPSEFGGPNIKIIITDFNHSTKMYSEIGASQLNPSSNLNLAGFENDAFYSIFTKYKGKTKDIKRFLQDVLFRYKPTEIKLYSGQVPYNENEETGDSYQPTNLVYFGDISKTDIKFAADNIHSQLCYTQEEFSIIENKHKFNYFCSYYDENLHKVLDSLPDTERPSWDSPKLLKFDDVIRINYEEHSQPIKYDNSDIYAGAYLIYSKGYDATASITVRNIILDDILEAVPTRLLQPLAKDLRLYKKDNLHSIASTFNKVEFSEVELQALEASTGLIQDLNITIEDVQNQIPIEFIIINDSDILDFEEHQTENQNIIKEKNNLSIDIIRRGLERGLNIHVKYYCKKDLPLEDIYSTFEAFIYSAYLNPKSQWKEDNRFIPECYTYDKKVYFGPKTKNFNLHPGLRFRINAAKNHAHSLKESQIRISEIEKNLYKSKIINNLLGYWGY